LDENAFYWTSLIPHPHIAATARIGLLNLRPAIAYLLTHFGCSLADAQLSGRRDQGKRASRYCQAIERGTYVNIQNLSI
jgi:hypothetical protein